MREDKTRQDKKKRMGRGEEIRNKEKERRKERTWRVVPNTVAFQ